MSGSCRRGQTASRAIPAKRLSLPDGAALPPGDYSTTPGGTVFGTTPGDLRASLIEEALPSPCVDNCCNKSKHGTRIIYDRKFLMECRNSPVAKASPCDLPDIPGVTSPNVEELKIENNHVHNYEEKVGVGEEAQFDMDI
ncbi:eukaryotic translation initiation factor 4E-binding protein 1 isoform X2 [Caretta caretta]|uniref:eukaryotic translation initiation factor 4E-binding protein 1 isoform X2 n=1 Tax=Caretta caretta TaxID=8467 RepID=UPI002094DE77|nr:eukaryotic translation initiation factor 4E-binding protein 1 isoform X2 [Caretta caretta]